MKIKNRENNKQLIYIQEKDIKLILSTESDIPQPLINACQNLSLSENGEAYLAISNEEIIDYIDSRPYLIDYREIKYLTEEEISEKIAELTTQKATLEEYSTSKDDYTSRLNQITYTIEQLSSYLTARQNKSIIDLPLTIDSEEMHMAVQEVNCLIGLSLNKSKILFRRLDNKPFTEKDNLPVGLVQAALFQFTPILEIPIEQPGALEVTAQFTEDGKFFAAEYKYTPLTQEQISDKFPMLAQPKRVKRVENKKRKTLFERFTTRKKDVEQ